MKIRSDEKGYIVVETVGTFVPFMLLVISILSLVNIVTLQARVHYALTQAANTLSMYSYVLEAVGAADKLISLDKDRVGDADSMIAAIISYAANESRNELCESFVRPLVIKYLANGDMSGDEYLRSIKVTSFEFTDSVVIDKNGDVKLSVKYEVGYTFGLLPLPFDPALSITQTAVTKAWLGGSGEGYW